MLRWLILVLKLLLACYVTVSVFFTTNLLVISPLRSAVAFLLSPFDRSTASVHSGLHPAEKSKSAWDTSRAYDLDSRFLRFSGGTMRWNTSDLSLKYGLGSIDPVLLDEDLFLAKAFSNSMHPRKIVPYFYRASGNFDTDDVTIATIITINRLQVFSRLVETYRGG